MRLANYGIELGQKTGNLDNLVDMSPNLELCWAMHLRCEESVYQLFNIFVAQVFSNFRRFLSPTIRVDGWMNDCIHEWVSWRKTFNFKVFEIRHKIKKHPRLA